MRSSRDPFVYVGNWDRHKTSPGNGFGICRQDSPSGALELIQSLVAKDITVGAACIDHRRNILYCVDEHTDLPGYFRGGGGQVYAFAVDPQTGELTEINHRPSFGALPAGLCLDVQGRYLVVAHHTDRVPVTKVLGDSPETYRIGLAYDDAATVLFPLGEDGSIGPPADIYIHCGDGGPLPRQTHPQLHSATMAPSGAFFVVCDKGNDELVPFKVDPVRMKLERVGAQGVKCPPGSSPRYIAFHPTRPYLFLNHETQPIVTAFGYGEDGSLTPICTVGVLPEDQPASFDAKQSDIVAHPNGRRLYTLLRGNSAVSCFDIDQDSGMIERTDTVALDCVGPRGCAISSDGRFMIVAALESQQVSVWAIDERGRLAPTGCKINQPHPGTINFF